MDRARLKLLGGMNEITVTEWLHGDIRFDGFWRPSCTAVEAKANYQQFLTAEGRPQPWLRKPTIFEKWLMQASAQSVHINGLGSPAKLEWHFLQRPCYRAAQGIFGPYRSVCRYTP
ncbi:hypothetical protein JR065_20885 [Xanthomonas sp. AmX2]|uniref:Tox-REase-5 domain-containing protein n=1 Tax=Xanthomonas sp. TaxID=29446 RepID=UPI00197FCD55|nr:Tox-REase-5 domain-containing protein [Xanthomonas sp.]MBN6152790.1 hypothetical protein [Xanthomonas sp.]